MYTNIFIDGSRLRRATTKSAIFFALFMAVIVFIFLKFNIFQSLPILRVFCLAVGIFITVKWAQSLKASYELAAQEEPCVQINDTGLTFIQKNMLIHIPWNQVIKIDHIPYPGGVVIYLTQDAKVENRPPFAKLGSNILATISYVTMPSNELHTLLLEYKDQFNQINQDPVSQDTTRPHNSQANSLLVTLMPHVVGVCRLSFPVIIVFIMNPTLFISFTGKATFSLLWGTYIWYRGWQQSKNCEKSLQYVPNYDNKNQLNDLIKECNIDPETVALRYGSTDGAIAMALHNTVIIDPITWHGLENDQEATKVKDIIENHIFPTFSLKKQYRITAMHPILNLAAQRFIVKHELGHIYHNFSNKKLGTVFIIGALATYAGIIAAMAAMPYGGYIATLTGMFVGGLSDLLLTFASNVVWKSFEEKKADYFAAQYSSTEDIKAAADFFEKHQTVMDTHKEPGNFLAFLPSIITSGHPHGTSRAIYLRKLASEKQ
jgi:hypothetical protein